jgi:sensor histidine kinase YesM
MARDGTLGRDEPTTLPASQVRLLLGAALAIGLQLGLFQAFIFGSLRPLIFALLGSLAFGLTALLLWQFVFPRLRGMGSGRRLFFQVLVALPAVAVTSFLVTYIPGLIQGTSTIFDPYAGDDINLTVAASQLRAVPTVLFLLPIIPVVLLIVVGFNQSWWQIFLYRRRASEARALAAAAELSALRTQINPHFLFNSLNSIAQLISADPARAEVCVERLAEIFRYLLRSENRTFVSLDEELAIADAYLDIERARFGEKLRVDFLVADEMRQARVPTLILQPLIENAVRHGISRKPGGGSVTIQATGNGKEVRLVVADTGVGLDRSPEECLVAGVGLRNVHDRLSVLFGEEFAPKMESNRGAGTRVEMRIPQNSGNFAEQESGARK